MLVFGVRLAERCLNWAGSMSNSRRAESSVTIVSMLSPSISGRAMPASTGVTRPIHSVRPQNRRCAIPCWCSTVSERAGEERAGHERGRIVLRSAGNLAGGCRRSRSRRPRPHDHGTSRRSARAMVRIEHPRLAAPAHRRHSPRAARPATAPASQTAGGARRGAVRLWRPPRYRLHPGRDVQRRAHRLSGASTPPRLTLATASRPLTGCAPPCDGATVGSRQACAPSS